MILSHIEFINLISWVKWLKSHLLDMKKSASKLLGLVHMDVQRLIISWPRDGHHIWDMVCSLICFTDLVITFWGYTLKITAYVLNLMPSKSISSTPYEIWKEKEIDCAAYVKRVDVYKFCTRSDLYKFIGYPKE